MVQLIECPFINDSINCLRLLFGIKKNTFFLHFLRILFKEAFLKTFRCVEIIFLKHGRISSMNWMLYEKNKTNEDH